MKTRTRLAAYAAFGGAMSAAMQTGIVPLPRHSGSNPEFNLAGILVTADSPDIIPGNPQASEIARKWAELHPNVQLSFQGMETMRITDKNKKPIGYTALASLEFGVATANGSAVASSQTAVTEYVRSKAKSAELKKAEQNTEIAAIAKALDGADVQVTPSN
jgi:hypothetical protein